MVNAYHVIFGTYGFWLPNDPRGSWSDFVGAWELYLRGDKATKTETRRSVAGAVHDRRARLRTKESLKYPEVRLTGIQAKFIGEAFGATADKMACSILACSILPQHVHLVLSRSPNDVEVVVRCLKAAATTALLERKLHPLGKFQQPAAPPPMMWARSCWKVFLTYADEMR